MEGPTTDSFDVLPGRSYRSFTEAAASILQTLERRLPGSVVYVAHLDGAENELRIIDSRGDPSFGLLPGTASPLDNSFSRSMAFEAAPRLANFAAEIDAYRDLPSRSDSNIGSYLGVPLTVGDGQAVASLCALSHETDSYTEDDLRMIGLMGRMLTVQLQNEGAERSREAVTEHLRELASTDPLTGLPNRRGLEPLLNRELRPADGQVVTTILLTADIDHFKRINEVDGRAHGDLVLRIVAGALADAGRSTDVVARIGPDEFAVLLVGGKGDQPTSYVERVTSALAATEQAPTLSFGWSRLATAAGPEHAIELANGLMMKRRAIRR
jgi:diguanylate cyclase (GGDEF)-like protein